MISRLLTVLVVLVIALAPAVRSQSPTTTEKQKPTPVVRTPGQLRPPLTTEDCACESQVLPDALAIVNGVRITRQDIEKGTGDAVIQIQRQLIEARKRELDLQINSKLLAIAAKKRGITTTRLLDEEVVAKVKEPTEVEAQTFFDKNRARIQSEFGAARTEVLNYLREQAQQVAAKRFADSLRATIPTRVNVAEATAPRNPAERRRVFAIVNGEQITSADIEDSLLPIVFNVQERVYKLRQGELDLSINDTLLTQEAQKRKLSTSALLDLEIKPRTVTEADARTFYEQNKERVSGEFEQTKESIVGYLQQIEVRNSERAFVEKLRAVASIQTLLIAPPPPVFSISTVDQPSLGSAAALVTIVEFTDYQCPACAATQPALERLVKEYGDKLRLVARDFPLSQHGDALKAAEAAEAAREQGKYWEYVQLLMGHQDALGLEKLKNYAAELKLDRAQFDQALDSSKFAATVQRDIDAGMRLGIDATPTVFINGRRVSDKSYEAMKAIVETELKAVASRQPPTTGGRGLQP
jgi:protein-disulfide isomerase